MSKPLVDHAGMPMFACARCGAPLTDDDFFELGLRLPERGESALDYFDAELLDELQHPRCTQSVPA